MKASQVFEKLAPLLVDAIPRAVKSLKLKQPIACVRLYYYDTHAPEGYITLRVVSEKLRAKLLKEKGRNALYYLWGSGEAAQDASIDLPHPKLKLATRKQMTDLFGEAYELTETDAGMAAYRKMMQAVARELNSVNWTKACPVTEDFVVAAADGSQCFADEYPDLAKSIPADRLKLLRKRGLLGPGENWDTRSGFDAVSQTANLIEESQAKAAALPVPERIDFWLGELDKVAAGKDNEMKRIGAEFTFAYSRLREIGPDAVLPIMEFVMRLFPRRNQDHTWAVALDGLHTVREMGLSSKPLEILLRDFLTIALKKKSDDLWAVHAANTLHVLFPKKYPPPTPEGNKIVGNVDAFLKVPIG